MTDTPDLKAVAAVERQADAAPAQPRIATHIALARRRVERIRTDSDGVAGGDLVIASLTRDGVNIELVRSFA